MQHLTFSINGDRLVGLTGSEALKVWIFKALKTKRNFYEIHSDSYGNDLDVHIGTVYQESIKNALIIRLPEISTVSVLEVEIAATNSYSYKSIQGRIFNILNNAQIEYDLKTKVMEAVRKYDSTNSGKVIGEIYSVCDNEYARGAVIELLSAK